MRILVLNAGSTSVKLSVVDDGDRVAAAAQLGPPDDGLSDQLAGFIQPLGRSIDAVGHRVVHGGSRFQASVVVDAATRRALDQLNALAPLHNPPALAGLDAASRLLPGIPSVVCFDTAFHAALPPEVTSYAVPSEWVSRWGVRRYGFHGLSCAWATGRAAQLLGRPARELRLVICHLGGGASVTAVAGGRSVDTTMGFTPLEGLVMATRPGDLDAGVLLWALQQGLSADQASEDLERRAGLLGLSEGRTSDMRELLARRAGGDATAVIAVSVYLHRLRAKIAAMTAAMQGLDALIFTGGVGEHSEEIRVETAAHLAWMGVGIDEAANAMVGPEDTDISAPDAKVRTLVIHAREELQVAAECRARLP